MEILLKKKTSNTIKNSTTDRLKNNYNSNARIETPNNPGNENAFFSNRPLTTTIGNNAPVKKDSLTTLKTSSNNDDKKSKTSTVSAYNPSSKTGSSSNSTTNGPDIWVKKWVDYSSKYGLGYLLSNNFTGVFYNDSSKIIYDPKTNLFNYIERRTSDKQEIVSSYKLTDYPKELTKKITLLQHFRSYLEAEGNKKEEENSVKINEGNNDTNNNNNNNININNNNNNTNYVYVKKWMRTKHAIMFRLSNKIVQVCFQDHTEIILSSESRIVTYVNKKAERSTYPLSWALDSNNFEMTKRLKYTKDILTHMLTSNNPNNNQGSTGTKIESVNI